MLPSIGMIVYGIHDTTYDGTVGIDAGRAIVLREYNAHDKYAIVSASAASEPKSMEPRYARSRSCSAAVRHAITIARVARSASSSCRH